MGSEQQSEKYFKANLLLQTVTNTTEQQLTILFAQALNRNSALRKYWQAENILFIFSKVQNDRITIKKK